MILLFNKLKCDYYFESVYDIPFSFYQENQIDTLFVDLDNTLAEDENRERPKHFEKWYADLTNHGLQLFVVSNNAHKKRVTDFMGDLPVKWYYRANKQNGRVFSTIIKENVLQPARLAVIGDRITTDVVAGKKVGAITILTKPLIKDKNPFTRFLIRPVEQFFIPQSYGANINE